MVKELREKTGAGMMDCKKALAESSGDFDRAMQVLREKGIAKATSKEGRTTSEGVIVSYVMPGEHVGALVEINCETDFVARTDKFREFAKSVARHVAETALLPESGSGDLLLKQQLTANKSISVGDAVTEIIAALGENTMIKRFARVDGADSLIATYVHAGDKLGVLVEVDGAGHGADDVARTFARDVAMHVAAAAPISIRRDEVNKDIVDKERAIFRKQAENEKKPAQIIDKIVEGRVEKFFAEVVLTEQPYVKDNDRTVGDYLRETGKNLGKNLTIKRFVRFRLGE